MTSLDFFSLLSFVSTQRINVLSFLFEFCEANSLGRVFIPFHYCCYCMSNKRIFNFISVRENFPHRKWHEHTTKKNIRQIQYFATVRFRWRKYFSFPAFFSYFVLCHSTIFKMTRSMVKMVNIVVVPLYHLNSIPNRRKVACKAANSLKGFFSLAAFTPCASVLAQTTEAFSKCEHSQCWCGDNKPYHIDMNSIPICYIFNRSQVECSSLNFMVC